MYEVMLTDFFHRNFVLNQLMYTTTQITHRRWPNVGPMSCTPLGQRRKQTSGQRLNDGRSTVGWTSAANVGLWSAKGWLKVGSDVGPTSAQRRVPTLAAIMVG